jgi:hypothetical protein
MAKNIIQFQKGMSLPDFMQQYGKEDKCRHEIFQLRWPNGLICPNCGNDTYCTIRKREVWIFPKKVDPAKRKVSPSVFHTQQDKDTPALSVLFADYKRLLYTQRWNVRYPDALYIVHGRPVRFSERR